MTPEHDDGNGVYTDDNGAEFTNDEIWEQILHGSGEEEPFLDNGLYQFRHRRASRFGDWWRLPLIVGLIIAVPIISGFLTYWITGRLF